MARGDLRVQQYVPTVRETLAYDRLRRQERIDIRETCKRYITDHYVLSSYRGAFAIY